ncbi:MAG: GNAT family N-acetyltransferase [Nitrospinota bacterium]
MLQIGPMTTDADLAAARALIDEYAQMRGVEACFDRAERHHKEMAELPVLYSPPGGAFFLAWDEGRPAGCIGLRDLGGSICEMKRLYVRPLFRGRGIGRQLAGRLVEEARRMGFSRMRLDTLAWMKEAHALYRSMGFREIPPYHDRGQPGELFMELALSVPAPRPAPASPA